MTNAGHLEGGKIPADTDTGSLTFTVETKEEEKIFITGKHVTEVRAGSIESELQSLLKDRLTWYVAINLDAGGTAILKEIT